MKKLVLGTVLALVALTLPLGMAGAQVAQAAGPVTTVYDSIQPSAVLHNVPSQPFQAQQTDEFGDIVRLAPGPRVANEFDVQMSSWACETGSGATCTTIPGHTFSHPITVTLYQVGSGDTPGPVILTKTQTIDVPFRPSYDPGLRAGRNIRSLAEHERRLLQRPGLHGPVRHLQPGRAPSEFGHVRHRLQHRDVGRCPDRDRWAVRLAQCRPQQPDPAISRSRRGLRRRDVEHAHRVLLLHGLSRRHLL